jgi:hypothetical protein
MNCELTEEQRAIQDAVRKIAERGVAADNIKRAIEHGYRLDIARVAVQARAAALNNPALKLVRWSCTDCLSAAALACAKRLKQVNPDAYESASSIPPRPTVRPIATYRPCGSASFLTGTDSKFEGTKSDALAVQPFKARPTSSPCGPHGYTDPSVGGEHRACRPLFQVSKEPINDYP